MIFRSDTLSYGGFGGFGGITNPGLMKVSRAHAFQTDSFHTSKLRKPPKPPKPPRPEPCGRLCLEREMAA